MTLLSYIGLILLLMIVPALVRVGRWAWTSSIVPPAGQLRDARGRIIGATLLSVDRRPRLLTGRLVRRSLFRRIR